MSSEKDPPEAFYEAIQEEKFLYSQLYVSELDYKDAVLRLVKSAKSDTSSSRAAAQVLLSLYNGHYYHTDLTDLCLLDYDLLYAALIAIRGRIIISIEPHEIIENGTNIFIDLTEKWSHLNISIRYAKRR